MPGPILLSTFGTHGDLFPVLSLAEALENEGQPARLLLAEEDAAISRARGLDTVTVGPPQAATLAKLGLTRDALIAQVFEDPNPMVRSILLPHMAQVTRESLPHAQDARAVIGTLFALGAPMLAELRGVPFVPLLLQPLMCYSALQPPRVPGLCPPMVADPKSRAARVWNRFYLGLGKADMRRRHLRGLNAVRAELSLPPTRIAPLFEFMGEIPLRLAFWDAAFAPLPADAPPHTTLCGFPSPHAAAPLPAALAAFLKAGPPPLCVSLGSMAQRLGGPSFYTDAVALARSLNLRVVLLSDGAPTPTGPDIHTADRADHTALFPHCAAVLHHGGIGTAAAALFAGKPHMIFPLGADQPDTAAHIERQGLGRRMPKRLDHRAASSIASAALQCAPACETTAQTLSRTGSQSAARALLNTLAP